MEVPRQHRAQGHQISVEEWQEEPLEEFLIKLKITKRKDLKFSKGLSLLKRHDRSALYTIRDMTKNHHQYHKLVAVR